MAQNYVLFWIFWLSWLHNLLLVGRSPLNCKDWWNWPTRAALQNQYFEKFWSNNTTHKWTFFGLVWENGEGGYESLTAVSSSNQRYRVPVVLSRETDEQGEFWSNELQKWSRKKPQDKNHMAVFMRLSWGSVSLGAIRLLPGPVVILVQYSCLW